MSEPLVDRVCAECGRVFCPAPYHRFKRFGRNGNAIYYCGWNCFSKAETVAKSKPRGSTPKIVFAYNTEGELLQVFSSVSEASEKTGLCEKSIRSCLNGRAKSTGGYIFKYEEKEQ